MIGYALTIFLATIAGSELEYKGCVEIPNLSDEFAPEEIDMNISIETKGPHENEIRHVLNKSGLEVIFDFEIVNNSIV